MPSKAEIKPDAIIAIFPTKKYDTLKKNGYHIIFIKPPKVKSQKPMAKPGETYCDKTKNGYYCTVKKGHKGIHVAHGGAGIACHSWK